MNKVFFLLLISFQLCHSQEAQLKIDTLKWDFASTTYTSHDSCPEGVKLATADFKKGIYNYYTYGLTVTMNHAEQKKQNYVRKYLKDKYAINYKHMGCIVTNESDCYNKTMIKLIEQKFGTGFLDKKIEEARKFYPKKTTW